MPLVVDDEVSASRPVSQKTPRQQTKCDQFGKVPTQLALQFFQQLQYFAHRKGGKINGNLETFPTFFPF